MTKWADEIAHVNAARARSGEPTRKKKSFWGMGK